MHCVWWETCVIMMSFTYLAHFYLCQTRRFLFVQFITHLIIYTKETNLRRPVRIFPQYCFWHLSSLIPVFHFHYHTGFSIAFDRNVWSHCITLYYLQFHAVYKINSKFLYRDHPPISLYNSALFNQSIWVPMTLSFLKTCVTMYRLKLVVKIQ